MLTLKSKLLHDYWWGTISSLLAIQSPLNLAQHLANVQYLASACQGSGAVDYTCIQIGIAWTPLQLLVTHTHARKNMVGQQGQECVCSKKKSPTCGWFVGVELRTAHVVDLRPHVGLACCQAYAICRPTCQLEGCPSYCTARAPKLGLWRERPHSAAVMMYLWDPHCKVMLSGRTSHTRVESVTFLVPNRICRVGMVI